MFPEDFLWGAATAGHQVEGGNVNSDIWAQEMVPDSYFVQPSGDACDSYHRFEEDISLLAGAGLNAYRFSIEWSRVEPDEGWFSRAELDHYRRMIVCCHEHDVTPIVSYNHFTTPFWFAQRGGWSADGAADRFARYADRVTAHLGDLISWATTLNEPNIMSALTHIGMAPIGASESPHGEPLSHQEAARIAAVRAASCRARATTLPAFQGAALEHYALAHRKATEAIKSGPGDQNVGWTLALVDLQPVDGGEDRMRSARQYAQLDWLEISRDDDFVGVQTYSRERIGADGMVDRPQGRRQMLTGWEFYPDALEHTVRMASQCAKVPVLVTENGCAIADDRSRIAYIEGALAGLQRCIDDGIDVEGYLHWSLLDNFEWNSGYAITFGLIAVDRSTFARTPKPSLAHLGRIALARDLVS
jgi:beta-glucosidase